MLPPSGGIDSNNIGKKDDENDDDLKSELESLKNFLKVDLFDAIKDIGSIVKNIESLLEDRNSLLKKESESERKTSVKSGFRGKEDELENKKKESKFGGILSAVTKPFTSLFDTIKNFLMNVLVGSLLNWLISIFQDPRKLLQPIQDLLDGIFIHSPSFKVAMRVPLVSFPLTYTFVLFSVAIMTGNSGLSPPRPRIKTYSFPMLVVGVICVMDMSKLPVLKDSKR
jgi:hypothetical protein